MSGVLFKKERGGELIVENIVQYSTTSIQYSTTSIQYLLLFSSVL